MCGISGVLLTSGASFKLGDPNASREQSVRQILEPMVRHLEHRGPDDRGISTTCNGGAVVGFGHTRLAILDLSNAGHQPMLDPSTRNLITYNGEIYNYRELRQELGEPPGGWKSNTDTEVILRAYAQWGNACVQHLRGMFAFALWDWQRQRLFLARDRLGIKPLYYYNRDGFFLFSSEVRSLLSSGVIPRELDPVSLNEYLAYQSVPAPRTMIQNIQALSPGTWMEVEASGHTVEQRYWDLLEGGPQTQGVTLPEAQKRIEQLLHDSIGCHLVSDVPVGVFLSGGIDSSAIVALMQKIGIVPRTFVVAFSEGNFDEARHASQVARHFGTEHSEIHLSEQNLLDELPGALAAMDQPTGDGINTYVVSGAVRSAGVTVALSGLGGDEFFAGYPSFRRFSNFKNFFRLWGHMPEALRSLAGRTVQALSPSSIAGTKTAAILASRGTIAELYPLLRQVLSHSQRQTLVKDCPDGMADPYVALLNKSLVSKWLESPLAQVSYAEASTYMHDVLLRDTDQMSMAHSLEVRVPLLDHKLVEYVMGLPDAYKCSNGIPKPLLISSIGVKLPPAITRRPKQGFTLPFDPWMRGKLKTFCEERLSPERTASRGLFRADEVQKLWRSFLAQGKDVSWSRLWVLVVL